MHLNYLIVLHLDLQELLNNQAIKLPKYLRDSKLCTIGEGTSEIQKLVILRHL